MRKCPQCAFENDDALPTCVWCNTSLALVPSVVPENPAHPDFARSVTHARRWRLIGKKYNFAVFFYACVIAATALIPGLVFHPGADALYFVSGAIVATGVRVGKLGQLGCGIVQGILSLALLVYFGPYQPFIFLMLALHIILGGLMWHWMTMITDTHR